MTLNALTNASAFALVLMATPTMLSAQMTHPAPTPTAPETPATPEIPVSPDTPTPPMPPVEVPAEPVVPDTQPEHIAKILTEPAAQSVYPPCSATLQDQCTEIDVSAARPHKMAMHRRHHKH
jgi:outer membrane biosynthesis protein TonB